MLGKKVNLSAPTNAGLYAVLGPVDTTSDTSGWTFQGNVYENVTTTTAALSMTLSWDSTEKELTATAAATSVAALLTAGEAQTTLFYDILCQPGGGELRFWYGDFTVVDGGPLWAA